MVVKLGYVRIDHIETNLNSLTQVKTNAVINQITVTATNKIDILRYLDFSAQGCVDTHDYCGAWNGHNLCENSYFRNMLKTFYCKKTCNAC